MRTAAVFYINGKRHEVGDVRAGWMLADYLRYDRGLTGTKIVCAEGDCGACSVLRWFAFPRRKAKTLTFEPINACITTVAQMDGSSLVTVEGLAPGNAPHSPVQQAMVQCHGSQCGFCTPGFVVALSGLVEKRLAAGESAPIARKEAQNALTGNLCRCTGYEPILQAAHSIMLAQCERLSERFLTRAIQKDLQSLAEESLQIEAEAFRFTAPASQRELRKALVATKAVRFLAAGTDVGVQVNKRKTALGSNLSLHLLSELYEIEEPKGENRWRVGARVTLAELRRHAEDRIPELSRFLDIFASPQIKNVATLVGNLVNGSPIADTIPFLLAANAVVHTVSKRGARAIALDKFYLGYRQTALRPGECVLAVEFDIPTADEKLTLQKVSQRKDLDISCVNAALRLQWKPGHEKQIGRARVALGGVAATPVRLKKVEAYLEAEPWNETRLEGAVELIQKEIEPLSDLRGSAEYRRWLVTNLTRRWLSEVSA